MYPESLMTSRKLTSGFDYCSCYYLRMAVMHLSTKFGENIFIRSGNIDIFFRNSIWRSVSMLDLRVVNLARFAMMLACILSSVQNLIRIIA